MGTSGKPNYATGDAFRNCRLLLTVATACMGVLGGSVQGDGGEDEGLGPPSVAVAPGTGIVAAGVGLSAQPNTITLDVPGSVAQALLYWAGEGNESGDDMIQIGKGGSRITRTGVVIGGPEHVFSLGGEPVFQTTYRADVTDLILPGPNTMVLSGLEFGPLVGANGAGLLVIYEDGDANAIEIRDGQDFAFAFFAPPLDATVPQTFLFDSSDQARPGTMTIFAASVGTGRPNIIRYQFDDDAPIELFNVLGSNDGKTWDAVELPFTVPAGASSMTIELISWDDETQIEPASLTWIVSALTLGPPEPFCGDGMVDPGEECDDGNNENGDGCDANCMVEPFCGDGMVDPGEECDDGNNDNGDGCDANCMVEPFCGDGMVDPGEECDDGNNDNGDGCDAKCMIESFCGDGVVDPGEECDDGNNENGDGCDAECMIESFCGDGVVDPGEECDGADDDACPGECSSDCQCVPGVPTVSIWGLVTLALLIGIFAKVHRRDLRARP